MVKVTKHKRKTKRGRTTVMTHKRKLPRIIRRSNQTKNTRKSLSRDRQRSALPAGLRESASGIFYYENRQNRSDQPGKKI